MKNKSFIKAHMGLAMLASSVTMLWLLWKFPLVTSIATLAVVVFLVVSARLAAPASDAESGSDLDQPKRGVGLH